MKAIPAVAVLFLLSAVAAQADSVVTGTLGFTCSGGCQPPLNNLYYDTAPTSGSFTYDKTTQQFLSFSIVWDGWTWTEPLSQLTQADYLALIGKGFLQERYFIGCIEGSLAPWPQFSCDQTEWFKTWRSGNGMGPFGGGDGYASVIPGPTTYPIDTADGTMFVTDLDKADKRGTVATPEPSGLALSGIGAVVFFLLGCRWMRREQQRREQERGER